MAEGIFVVTGGSRGIGQAIARRLVDSGREVVCLSRSGAGPFGQHLACDMTDESAVRATLRKVAEQGPIVGLVNNAGVHIGGSAESLSVEDFNRTMALNATAVMVTSREAFPFMRQNGGSIVNIGSFFDKIGAPDNLAYCASKAAVAAMTRVMAVEWARYGISVVDVAPGYIETDLNRDFLAREKVQAWLKSRVPVGHAGKPEDVARVVVAVLTEASPYLTGETIYVDGAQGINH